MRLKNRLTTKMFFITAIFLVAGCNPTIILNQPHVETLSTNEIIETVPAEITEAPQVSEPVPTGWSVEVVVEGLEVPWSIIFTSPERMLVSERKGAIRVIRNGFLESQPAYVFEDITSQDEAGLMGLALDPAYEANQYIYACYATTEGSNPINRIVRLRDAGDLLTLDAILLDDIPSARFHAGCRIRFGPDRKLYITSGDALDGQDAQEIDSLAGKILRMNSDGTVPVDNPFPGSLVYSYGHRNPQGIDWHPVTGKLFATEHGPSGFDGPPGGDEINLIQAGGNYGWPLVSHDRTLEGTLPPLIQFTPAEAPGSGMFYSSDRLPMFTGSFFFGALRGEGLVRVVFETSDPIRAQTVEKIVADVGRVRDVVEGLDGLLYFSTSNRDGRGNPQAGDDRILRLVPIYE
jgi:glucose/arabinose dehydrogenase